MRKASIDPLMSARTRVFLTLQPKIKNEVRGENAGRYSSGGARVNSTMIPLGSKEEL